MGNPKSGRKITPRKPEQFSNFMKCLVFGLGLGLEFGWGYFSKVRVWIGVTARGEKCFRYSRNFNELSVKLCVCVCVCVRLFV